MWRIPWISWAHSRWRLQRRWKGSKKQTLRNCSKFKVTSRLDISINWLMQQSRHDGNKLWSSSWKNIQLAKALTWLALLIVFSSTKKSMDQLPTDHHPLLQVRIQSEHSGVIGSTKSATAWHMCRRNRQSCYAVNKSDSKCYTQPLPSIEKHCIWWYSIYVYTYIYICPENEIFGLNQKKMTLGCSYIFCRACGIQCHIHGDVDATPAIWGLGFMCQVLHFSSLRFVTLIPSIKQQNSKKNLFTALAVLLYTVELRRYKNDIQNVWNMIVRH